MGLETPLSFFGGFTDSVLYEWALYVEFEINSILAYMCRLVRAIHTRAILNCIIRGAVAIDVKQTRARPK